MSLFTIDISELLPSPVGTIAEFRFDQELDGDTFEELICTEPLIMHIKLVRREFGIECLFVSIDTAISLPEEGIENKPVALADISREFHLKKRKEDTDDIEYINDHDGTIDLGRVVAQELVIAGL